MKKIIILVVLILAVSICLVVVPVSLKVDSDNTDALLVASAAEAIESGENMIVRYDTGDSLYPAESAEKLFSMLGITERTRTSSAPDGESFKIILSSLEITIIKAPGDADLCYAVFTKGGRVRTYEFSGYDLHDRIAKLYP